jgi:hypothetical protein
VTADERQAAWEAVEKMPAGDAKFRAAHELVKKNEHGCDLAMRVLAAMNDDLKKRAGGRYP